MNYILVALPLRALVVNEVLQALPRFFEGGQVACLTGNRAAVLVQPL